MRSSLLVSARPFKILIVEDNPHVLEIFRYAFRRIIAEKFGEATEIQLAVAEDGMEAWERILGEADTGTPYDLVILDLMLPVLDGQEVLSRARADARLAKMPVVVITASDEETCQAAMDAGATALLRKPVQFAAIRDAVSNYM